MTKEKKALKKVLKQYADSEYNKGWDDGWEAAAANIDSNQESFNEGVQAEHKRIQALCAMQMKWAEEQGKGAEYMRWKQVSELIIPIEVDHSEEAYQRNLEADGF